MTPPSVISPAWLTAERDRAPPYPDSAYRAGIEGRVLLRVCVDLAGRVERAEVVRGLGFGCDEAAAAWATERWRFRPARQGDVPIVACMLQWVRFELKR